MALSQKIVGILCFVCFILHSAYLIYTNKSNAKSVDNSRNKDLSQIPFPLKIQVNVDPGRDEFTITFCIHRYIVYV